MSPQPFTDRLVEWLNRRVAPPGIVIDADTELFAGGLVDSLRILEVIAWTERETGRTIADRDIRMDNFQTPRRIAEVFAGAPDTEGPASAGPTAERVANDVER